MCYIIINFGGYAPRGLVGYLRKGGGGVGVVDPPPYIFVIKISRGVGRLGNYCNFPWIYKKL